MDLSARSNSHLLRSLRPLRADAQLKLQRTPGKAKAYPVALEIFRGLATRERIGFCLLMLRFQRITNAAKIQ